MTDSKRFAAVASAYDRPEPHFDADLTQVGRGTPMGELLRRYWQPVYKADKLKDLPVEVRAFGEAVILFRKPDGAVGAMYPRCIHRGTSLLYGKVTDKGLRCCYHGWTFETDGHCTDQPCEPDGGAKTRASVRQPWYPVEERYGFIFIYMGPPDRKPPFPRYDVLEDLPEGWDIHADDTTIPSGGAGYMPCNWLQHHENGMDPAHVPIVHEHQFPPIMAQAETTYGFERMPDRVRGRGISKIGPMMMEFKVDMPLPNVRVIPDPLLANPRPDGKSDSVAWTVPTDDTDTIVFTAIVKPVGAPAQGNAELYNGKAWTDLSFEEHQRFPGDFEAQVGQGPITYHSEEHLTPSDQGIMFLRRLLRSAMKDVAEGRDPPLAFGQNDILVETWAGVRMTPNPDYVESDAAPAEDAVATPVAASGPGDASGRWSLTMSTPMGEQTASLTLVQLGESLSGVINGDQGDIEITDGKAKGAGLRWKAKVSKPFPMTLSFDVKVQGDSLSGTFKPGMFPAGPVTGVRQSL